MKQKKTFLGLLYVAEELIKTGHLNRDPHNPNNILICKEKDGKTCWVSENIHIAMSRCFNNDDELNEFLNMAEKSGVNTEACFENARTLISHGSVFESAEQMLSVLYSDKDLYNPNTETFVFRYSEDGDICVYTGITTELASYLSKENNGYGWASLLSASKSSIYEDENVLVWCKENYSTVGWVTTDTYQENLRRAEVVNAYSVRLLYDGTYYVLTEIASSPDEVREKIISRLNTAKEYEILSVKKVNGVAITEKETLDLDKERITIPLNNDMTRIVEHKDGKIRCYTVMGIGENAELDNPIAGLYDEFSEQFFFKFTTGAYNVSNMTSGEIISSMNESEKDSLYRMLWAEHVTEDVNGVLAQFDDDQLSDMDEDDYEEFVKTVVNRYVYDGDYDCNLSYWDNLDNLIKEELEKE